MRWQPDTPICQECGFDWRASEEDAIAEVAASQDAVAGALRGVVDPTKRTAQRWSASMYVWHVVDVLRIGTERLLTMTIDPERGIPCWDEKALAEDRRYEQLSVTVGVEVLGRAAREWVEIAQTTPAAVQVDHPLFGSLSARDVIRRNAHEVRHHVQDIERWRPAPATTGHP